MGKLVRTIKRACHALWVSMEESGAIMAGVPIELDPRYTGDKFSPSPVVREVVRADVSVHEHTEIHRRRGRHRRRHRH